MRSFLCPAAVIALVGFSGTATPATAYTGDNHEKSVHDAAGLCADSFGAAPSPEQVSAIARGAREPDDLSIALLEIGVQRVEPGARGRRRSINPTRIAEQSFHGSPNPTRAPYTDSPEDRALRSRATLLPASELLSNRHALDVLSYDTNLAVRNKLLVNTSQLLCVSLAHRDDRTSAKKFGNFLHMVGDTYSASHVQRSRPNPPPDRCGTETIDWFFSMDLVVWKNHAGADRENGDWRFRCLVEHAAGLLNDWLQARAATRAVAGAEAKRAAANAAVTETVEFLCENVLRAAPEVLARPAGGAAAGYSIASGTDNWETLFTFWRTRPPDRPIQPIGLTGVAEARAFVAEVNAGLAKAGRPPWFAYPERDAGDYCAELAATRSLPEPLRCTAEEIGWAMEGAPEVDPLVIPPRGSGTPAPS